MKNGNTVSTDPNRTSAFRRRAMKAAAATAMVGTLAGGLAACGGGEAAPQPQKATATTKAKVPVAEATPRQTAEAQLKAAEQQAKANLQVHAVDAALSVVSILSNPNAGTENYNNHSVGNKAAVVGPDRKYPTADDAQYRDFPEALARYYPDTNLVLIRATGAHNETSDNPHFWGVDTLFKVEDGNPITQQTGQLTASDFRAALGDEGSISLVAVSGTRNSSFDEETGKSTGSNAGLWLSEAGFISNQDLSVYDALENRLPDPADVITDPSMLIRKVNYVSGVVNNAASQLVIDAQR